MHERFVHHESSWHAGLEASINQASRLTLSVTVNPASVTINSDSNSDGMSITIQSCRLERPENKGLKPYFDKLSKAKEAIDARSGKIGARCFVVAHQYALST